MRRLAIICCIATSCLNLWATWLYRGDYKRQIIIRVNEAGIITSVENHTTATILLNGVNIVVDDSPLANGKRLHEARHNLSR